MFSREEEMQLEIRRTLPKWIEDTKIEQGEIQMRKELHMKIRK